MSEANPTANTTPSTAANPVATTPTIPPGTPGKAPAKTDAAKAAQQPADAAKPTPEQDRDADLKRLSDLQREYLDLKEKTGKGPAVLVQVDPNADALARKGDVTREMDAIKRKHGLA
jgi:hypothetical protein